MRALRILAVGLAISLAILLLRWSQNRAPTEIPDHSHEKITAGEPHDLPPLKLGDLVPDTTLTDQDGNDFRLSDLRGKVIALSFIYTNCDMPSFCPMTTAKLLDAQSLAQERKLANVEFVGVSFDVERDEPAKLKDFALRYEADFSSFRLATSSAEEIAKLSRALNTYFQATPSGQFEHNAVTSVVDREGMLREQFVGTAWTIEELVHSIERIGGS